MANDIYDFEFKTKNGYGKAFSSDLNMYNILEEEGYEVTKVSLVDIVDGKLTYTDITKEEE